MASLVLGRAGRMRLDSFPKRGFFPMRHRTMRIPSLRTQCFADLMPLAIFGARTFLVKNNTQTKPHRVSRPRVRASRPLPPPPRVTSKAHFAAHGREGPGVQAKNTDTSEATRRRVFEAAGRPTARLSLNWRPIRPSRTAPCAAKAPKGIVSQVSTNTSPRGTKHSGVPVGEAVAGPLPEMVHRGKNPKSWSKRGTYPFCLPKLPARI